jgi:hypothetical protein
MTHPGIVIGVRPFIIAQRIGMTTAEIEVTAEHSHELALTFAASIKEALDARGAEPLEWEKA